VVSGGKGSFFALDGDPGPVADALTGAGKLIK
jgi:hypothetical protein